MTVQAHPQQPLAPLLQAAFGGLSAQILYVAAKLELADHLNSGPKSASDIADLLGVDSTALQRIFRGLASLQLCEEIEGARFRMTPLGEHLRVDHPQSVWARVVLNAEVHQPMWNELLSTVKTGVSASQRVYGTTFYDHIARNPSAGALFDRTMASAGWIQSRFRPAAQAYDFGQFRSIVDVGGGNGSLMVEILRAHSRPRGTVFDLPRLAESARQTIGDAGVSQRCQFVGGDAFDAVPANSDAYILSNFVNSWGDKEASVVLANCRSAMGANGRLLLIDWIIPTVDEPRNEFAFWDSVTMDLIMLAAFGSRHGHIRSKSAFSELLRRGGFALKEVIPTHASVCVIEAVPA